MFPESSPCCKSPLVVTVSKIASAICSKCKKEVAELKPEPKVDPKPEVKVEEKPAEKAQETDAA